MAGDRPKMDELYCLCDKQEIRVIERIASRWNEVALALHFDGHIIALVHHDTQGRAMDSTIAILQRWLDGGGYQPVTWNTLIEGLRTSKFNTLAEELSDVMAPS